MPAGEGLSQRIGRRRPTEDKGPRQKKAVDCLGTRQFPGKRKIMALPEKNADAIRVERVYKRMGTRNVLEGIDLSFRRAQTHVLLGPSGCGKSTLLRLMLGLERADSGRILVEDLPVTPETQPQLAPRMGYVVQDGGLFPHLSAAGNIALPARVRGWPKKRIRARVSELAQLADLDCSLLQRYPRELSGGQKQRVGLLRALMLDPAFCLLDEPLGALDPVARSSLQTALKKIFNAVKKTVIMVTHDIGEAAFFGHSITLLHRGTIAQKGTMEDLLERPADAYVTEFLSSQRPPPEAKS